MVNKEDLLVLSLLKQESKSKTVLESRDHHIETPTLMLDRPDDAPEFTT